MKTVWTFRVKESVKDKFSSGTALGDLTIHFYNGALWWWHCKFAPTTKVCPVFCYRQNIESNLKNIESNLKDANSGKFGQRYTWNNWFELCCDYNVTPDKTVKTPVKTPDNATQKILRLLYLTSTLRHQPKQAQNNKLLHIFLEWYLLWN